jgi:hypothetical protein
MPSPRPYNVIIQEGKSHRTKAELSQRKKGEEESMSGVELKERPEVKDNPVAHKEFLRLKKLLKNIGKNDAIYEPIINRYCILQAECQDFESKRDKVNLLINELTNTYYNHNDGSISFLDYMDRLDKLQKSTIAMDKQVQTKRKMLLDIEKENIMTIAAALRSIPKKVEKSSNKLLEALNEN